MSNTFLFFILLEQPSCFFIRFIPFFEAFIKKYYSKGKLTVGQKVTLDGVTGQIIDIDKTSITMDCGDRKVIIPLNKLSKERIEIHN